MDENELKFKLLYYLRGKYFHTMQKVAQDGLTKYSSEPMFKLFNVISMILCGHIQESINELESFQSGDITLATLVSLLYAYKQLPTLDKEMLQKLDSQLKETRRKSDASELYYAALFLFACKKYDKSQEYVDRCIKLNENHIDAVILRGWINIYLARNEQVKPREIKNVFSPLLNDKKNLDASFGEIEYYEIEKKYEFALSSVNKAIVKYPSMIEPLIRKMKTQLAMHDWEQTCETMNRITNTNIDNIEALKMNVLVLICRDGNYDEAVEYLRSFYKALEKTESKNSALFMENSQLFSRICGRNKSILSETFNLAEKAVQLNPNNSEYVTELGYQCLLQGKIKDAVRYYKSATKMNDASMGALIGMILCELTENSVTEQIHHQMEFLLEMQGSDKSPMLLFIQSKLATSPDKSLKYLNEAIDVHLKSLRWYCYSDTYLRLLDPDFLLDIIKEYLQYAPKQLDIIAKSNILVGPPSPVFKKSIDLLKIITKACPGLHEGLYLLARVYYLTGNSSLAMNTLQHILKEIDATSIDAHLLLAQIYIQKGSYQRAAQSLEVGLSYNFKVRENSLYHFINAMVHKYENSIDETIKSLNIALSLVVINPTDTSYKKNDHDIGEFTLADKASLYVELINVYHACGQLNEANKVLEDAIDEFKGTSEEGRIMILTSEQALEKRDVKIAIDLLNKIKPEEPYYMQAHTKLAEVYLKLRRDRSAFMQCFREIVEHCPGPDSYLLYGDACMSIQEPERAIDAYERALNCNPKDPILASKMGIALVKTHQYQRAISYYKDAVKSTENSDLKIDLTNLYMKLKQFDKAEMVIKDELEIIKRNGDEDFLNLQSKTRNLVLLAKILEKSGNITEALKNLKDARDCQSIIQKRLPLEQPGSAEEQLKITVEICIKMAELSAVLRNNDNAVHCYKEALNIYPMEKDILVALAKLYMQMNYLELCQQTCSTLLKTDPDNEAASVMMADLAFRKVDFDAASFHFKQLLNKQPTYWTALARLIEVMRRTGGIEEVANYLSNADEFCTNSGKEPGLTYCKGLYEWYSGNPNAALRYFNSARQDSEWGQQAIYNMIEICLNPEDEILGDAFDSIEDVEYRDSRSMALRTAERLLKELKPRPGGIDDEALRHQLLGNFLLLATKQKTSIERALDEFVTIASQEAFKDHIGPILGTATAYLLLKQTQRARTQLKRVAKNVWTFEDAEYLERCWLLLADIYLQSTKYDLAMDLLRRVLQHNKTCTKAYELSGYISEKEQHYKEASNYYDNAWKYSGYNNPAVGYKLAYNYMKSKKFADAIDVSNQVLKLHPDYPKIRKDILDKSLNNLRT